MFMNALYFTAVWTVAWNRLNGVENEEEGLL